MEHEQKHLHLRQLLCKEDIEKDSKRHHSDDKQSAMPAVENVRTVIEDKQALDLDTRLKCSRDDSDLPSEDGEPADSVAEDLLVLGRSEFGYLRSTRLEKRSHAEKSCSFTQ